MKTSSFFFALLGALLSAGLFMMSGMAQPPKGERPPPPPRPKFERPPFERPKVDRPSFKRPARGEKPPAGFERPKPVVRKFSEELAETTKRLNPEYLVFGPVESEETLPTIIFLHGGGGGGNDVKRIQGQPGGVFTGAKRFGHGPLLVIAPQCVRGGPPKGIWHQDDLNPLLAELLKTLPIDPKRIYLTGNSMGGYGSWMWGGHNPEHFAAILPVVGGIGPGGPKDVTPNVEDWAANLAKVSVWGFAGGTDKVVPAERTERMVKAIREAGGTKAKMTIYDGEGHNAGRLVWKDEDVYKWIFEQRRL